MLRKLQIVVGSILISFSAFCDERTFNSIDEYFDITSNLIVLKSYDSAYAVAQEAFLISKHESYSWGKANALYVKGWCRYKQNENSEALLLFLESLQVLQEEIPSSERTFSRTGLHMNIGRIYSIYSNFEGAHKFYEQGLEIARNYGHKMQEIKFLYNDGVSYKYQGNTAKAAERFIETKHLSLEEQSSRWYFNSINQLGLINKDVERYDTARKYYDKALSIVDQLKDPERFRSMIYHNIGVSYFLQKEYEVAESNFLMALESKDDFLTRKDLTELYVETEQFELAFDFGQKAIDQYGYENLTPDNASIFKLLGDAALAIGKYEIGSKYIDKYTTEINKYLETREYTKKLEDAYQIDLLTKQYFLKLEQQKRQAQIIQLSWFFGIVVFAFILLFFAQRWYQKRKKADATDAIKAIFNQSEILRGSLDREL